MARQRTFMVEAVDDPCFYRYVSAAEADARAAKLLARLLAHSREEGNTNQEMATNSSFTDLANSSERR